MVPRSGHLFVASSSFPIISKDGRIVGRNAFFYINEYGNPRRGYFRAEVDDSIINLINKYLSEVKFDDIIDSTVYKRWEEEAFYHGYSYLLFLTDRNGTRTADYANAPVYKKQFASLTSLMDTVDRRLKLDRLVDTAKLKSEFDSLRQTILHEKTKDLPPLYIKFKSLPPVGK